MAGPVADRAAEAEASLSTGNAVAALAAFDAAAAAFWDAVPLQLRVVAFADDVKGFGNYQPRTGSTFRHGDTLKIYFEPYGFGFTPDGDGFKSALAVDVEVQTPGGLVLGKAADVTRLEWSGRAKMHEVHATVALPLPELKPGDYKLIVTLRDQASPKTASAELPFSVAE